MKKSWVKPVSNEISIEAVNNSIKASAYSWEYGGCVMKEYR